MQFLWDQWLSHFSADIAIDLGTANTPVLVKGRGIRLREPSYVAIDTDTNKVVAVGHEAKMMAGRTPPYLTVVRPIRDGVIANFEIAEEMMRYLLSRVNGQGLLRPRVIVGVPSDVTPVERRAVSEAAMKAGARVAYLIEQPLAAAIGAGLPVLLPKGSMVLDIGGGTSEAAVIALGGIVTSTSIRVAGDEMDEAIITHMRRTHNLLIGDRTAEEIKIEAAAALPQAAPRTVQVRGRDLTTGLPATRAISGNDLVDPLKDIVNAIADAVKSTLEVTPPELSADIMESGIVLAGGGALLPGLDEYLTKATGVQCVVAADAIYAVVRGAERLFMDPKLMHAIFEHSH